MRCPNIECGAEVKEGSAFCERCGTPIPVAMARPDDTPVAFCEHCGAKLSQEAAFCKSCGRPVRAAGEVWPARTSAGQPRTAVPVPTRSPATGTAAAPVVTGKKSSRIGLRVAIVILAVAVVTLGVGLGGTLTNWYGLGRAGGAGSTEGIEVWAIECGEDTGDLWEDTYDSHGNLCEQDVVENYGDEPYYMTRMSYDADGRCTRRAVEYADDEFADDEHIETCEYELDIRGRRLSCTTLQESGQVIGKSYFSYHSDDTLREIKSCYVEHDFACYVGDDSDLGDCYGECVLTLNEAGLPVSKAYTIWPSQENSIDIAEYEASVRRGIAPEGHIFQEYRYKWSYDDGKPVSVVVQTDINLSWLENVENAVRHTTKTYDVDTDGHGNICEIRSKDDSKLLRLRYTPVRCETTEAAINARSNVAGVINSFLEW